jgi:hypothetical protein
MLLCRNKSGFYSEIISALYKAVIDCYGGTPQDDDLIALVINLK